jgi:hypothetical protein
MTLDEALEMFAKYGNVCPNVENLRLERPSMKQLATACEYALARHGVGLGKAAVVIHRYWRACA